MSRGGRAAALAVLLGALGACATTAPPPTAPGGAPPAVAAPAAAPARPAPSRRETLAAEHRDRALALERDGMLRRAVDEWDIALAIAPADPQIREGRTRLLARIEDAVTARIEEGRAALARGSHPEARRRFLAALALDPANRVAFEALQTQVQDIAFIAHTVRAGDTLAALAQRYYGDRSRAEVIWETNRLPPSPRLVAGSVLKIPEIPGVPFVRPEPRRDTPPPPARPEPPARTEPPPRDDYQEMNPLLADAHEAFERNEYAAALTDLDAFLAGHPGNREGLDLKKLALYRHGKQQLDQKEYDDSFRTLTQLVRLQPDYQDSPKLLQQARARVIERHYSEGLRRYREEKLPEAIAEWRVVLEVDPNHANARRNIEQAERLLKGLEERRKR